MNRAGKNVGTKHVSAKSHVWIAIVKKAFTDVSYIKALQTIEIVQNFNTQWVLRLYLWNHLGLEIEPTALADPGGGVLGSGPPFSPRCRLFNIGPKAGPPLFT